jgi:uncharacterized membrane protein YdbT with pleckstrin-like domain
MKEGSLVTTESKPATSGGIGFFGLLAIVFITLKLCGVIDWSWWWVTAPLWGPLAALLVVIAIGLVVFVSWFTVAFVVDLFGSRRVR